MQNQKETGLQISQEAVHMQAELPTEGTALNPLESEWVMNEQASAMPVDQLANAMQQGE